MCFRGGIRLIILINVKSYYYNSFCLFLLSEVGDLIFLMTNFPACFECTWAYCSLPSLVCPCSLSEFSLKWSAARIILKKHKKLQAFLWKLICCILVNFIQPNILRNFMKLLEMFVYKCFLLHEDQWSSFIMWSLDNLLVMRQNSKSFKRTPLKVVRAKFMTYSRTFTFG